MKVNGNHLLRAELVAGVDTEEIPQRRNRKSWISLGKKVYSGNNMETAEKTCK